jgi:NAD(P)-dependent dehydrogenase (short-subunit alcohol dehydrogenase family)
LQFIRDGCYRLLITDLFEETLLETVQEARQANSEVQIEYLMGDLTAEEVVHAAVSKTVARFGRLDYAVNIAGVQGKLLATDMSELEDYRHVQQVNVESLWLCERAELRAMLSQEVINGCTLIAAEFDYRCRGSIVNLCSTLGLLGSSIALPYVASKHAVAGITKSDALAYALQGIRVNCVAPGYTWR